MELHMTKWKGYNPLLNFRSFSGHSNKQEPFLMARDLKEYIKASERAKHSSMIASYTPDNNAICE